MANRKKKLVAKEMKRNCKTCRWGHYEKTYTPCCDCKGYEHYEVVPEKDPDWLEYGITYGVHKGKEKLEIHVSEGGDAVVIVNSHYKSAGPGRVELVKRESHTFWRSGKSWVEEKRNKECVRRTCKGCGYEWTD